MLTERKKLLPKIGKEGNIQVGQSLEKNKKIGRVITKVKASIVKLEANRDKIMYEFEAPELIEKFPDSTLFKRLYLDHLVKVSEGYALGVVSEEELAKYQKEYEDSQNKDTTSSDKPHDK